jgi:hypothetical protein
MERVETLFNVLSDKMLNKASIGELLITVRMMESELVHLKNIEPPTKLHSNSTASFNIAKQTTPVPVDALAEIDEPKTVEVLNVNEAEVEAELKEIGNAYISIPEPEFVAEKINETDEILQVEINEKEKKENTAKELNDVILIESFSNINDEHKGAKNEIIDVLKGAPILDLKKAIGVNERFLYLNELFRGDEMMYDKSIKTINSFANFTEAELWIRRELTLRLGWDENYTTVQQFYSLIKRRFS